MAKKAAGRPRVTAETMAAKQRDISVSEFFAKNRHLLGFDNPRKALLTTIKEAVDNSLDACEEAGILPDIQVKIEELVPPPSPTKPGRYRITILDNGPGIVRKQIENIFGRLLYGSKFHRLKMSRGQQGIGISAAGIPRCRPRRLGRRPGIRERPGSPIWPTRSAGAGSSRLLCRSMSHCSPVRIWRRAGIRLISPAVTSHRSRR